MSESPKERPVSLDKETVPIAPANSDVELGDRGILVHAAPLARKLKGRHMQMIAIGKYLRNIHVQKLMSAFLRWCDRCWIVRWLWKCFGNRRARKFGTCNPLLLFEATVVTSHDL